MLSLARLIIAEKPSMFQMIMRKKYSANFMESDLEETERSDGGFGSTDQTTEKIMDIKVEK
jgi:dUTPase